MAIVMGFWLAVAGCVAILAGASAARRVRRLRQYGQTSWALVVAEPNSRGDEMEPGRTLLQYPLADGRVIERPGPPAARRASRLNRRTLTPGEKVLIWYDPADPGDVLVFGRDGRNADRFFTGTGSVLLIVGVLIAAIGR